MCGLSAKGSMNRPHVRHRCTAATNFVGQVTFPDNDLDAVQSQCEIGSNRQGAEKAQYSKQKKKKLGLP